MNDNKSTKRNVLGSLILVMSIVIIGISTSYAYFINTVEEVNSENKGVSVTSGALTMNFATVEDKYINANAASLINDSDVTTKADYTTFSVTLPSGKVSAASYNLFLTDIKMTQNFKSEYLKWALYSAEGVQVATGDFSGVTMGTQDGTNDAGTPVYDVTGNIPLKTNIDIASGATDTYKLYVWLSYVADVQQNSLLNGSLSAKVGFRGVTK